MLDIIQAKKRAKSAGEPIYLPFDCFANNQLFIRRSQLTMIAGGPGTGKSALVQYICQQGDSEGNRNSVFYFSADSDAGTMINRAGAIATGWDQFYVDQQLHGDEHQQDAVRKKIRDATEHIRWSFTSNVEDWAIEDELAGYHAIYGSYPEVIVVDNLKDLHISDTEGEFQALEAACMFLHEIAKETGAAVIVTHHVMGNEERGDKPIGIDGIRGKVTKTPECVITLHRVGNVMNVSPVKNRSGIADTTGNRFYSLDMNLANMQFRDMPPPVSNFQGTGFSNTTLGDRQ